MNIKNITLTPVLYEYLHQVSLREAHYLKQLREETSRLPNAVMQITPEQGQFMTLLAKLISARKILEIGVFTGYSSLCLAQALPADGLLIALDINEDYTNIAKRYWEAAGLTDRIRLKLGNALESLEKLHTEYLSDPFDLVFIDADKTNYNQYYESALKLLRQGGLVIIDNTLWNGYVADNAIQDEDTKAIRELNLKIHADNRVSMSLLPVADGLTLAMKL